MTLFPAQPRVLLVTDLDHTLVRRALDHIFDSHHKIIWRTYGFPFESLDVALWSPFSQRARA